MSSTILVRSRQQVQLVDLQLLRRIARTLVLELLPSASVDLAIYVVAAPEMTRLNETFLKHRGSTDVLTFDYSESTQRTVLCGEVFICLDEARLQAIRFHTTWQSELVRYMAHGILHLSGYDDHSGAKRRKMKQEENRLLKELTAQFEFSRLAKRRL